MSRNGLLRLYGPAAYGGSEAGESELVSAGEQLVRYGGNLGIALSWLVHNLISRQVIDRFATEPQKRRYLRSLAAGETTVAMAVSEPGMGGSPKHMTTTAVRVESGYRLNGRKIYLTNGPIADLFVVFAVTGETGGRKRFGTFLVERDSPGLTITSDGTVDFLRPSPHGGIGMDNCLVRPENLLGDEGDAFNAISKPFRFIEDTLGMGLLLGGMKWQLDWVAKRLRDSAQPTDIDVTAALGRLYLTVETIDQMTRRALDEFAPSLTTGTPPKSLLAARLFAGRFQDDLTDFLDGSSMTGDSAFNLLTRDMQKLTGLGRGIAEVHHRRLGLAALETDEVRD